MFNAYKIKLCGAVDMKKLNRAWDMQKRIPIPACRKGRRVRSTYKVLSSFGCPPFLVGRQPTLWVTEKLSDDDTDQILTWCNIYGFPSPKIVCVDFSQLRICTLPLLRNGPILIEDAHSAKSSGISIFLFLFFELCLIVHITYGGHTWIFKCVTDKKKCVKKFSNLGERCTMSWNKWKISFTIFSFFIFWVMVDFVLKIP